MHPLTICGHERLFHCAQVANGHGLERPFLRPISGLGPERGRSQEGFDGPEKGPAEVNPRQRE